MTIENGKISSCNELELFDFYLSEGIDDFMSFLDYKKLCRENGTSIVGGDILGESEE